MTLPYETIFSRVRGQIDDPKELSLDASDLIEIYSERLHSVAGNPRIRTKFSSLSFDDEIQKLTYVLKETVDDESDREFVIELFTLGIIIEWLKPQVDSILHTAPMIGGKEEKLIINNHRNMINQLEDKKRELNKKLRDYGYLNNSYIRGN